MDAEAVKQCAYWLALLSLLSLSPRVALPAVSWPSHTHWKCTTGLPRGELGEGISHLMFPFPERR